MCARPSNVQFISVVFSALSLIHQTGLFAKSVLNLAPNLGDCSIAVVRNGGTETILITGTLRSKKLTDLIWTIPIPSRRSPLVKPMDSDAFSDMNWILQGYESRQMWTGFEVLTEPIGNRLSASREADTFQVDVLDLGPDAAQNWAREIALRSEDTAHSFLVVVRANPALLYKEDLDFVRQQKWLSDMDDLSEKTRVALSALHSGRAEGSLSDRVARDILLQEPYKESEISDNPLNQQYALLTQTKYSELLQKYGMDREVLLRTFQFDSRPERFIDMWFGNDYQEITFWNGDKQRVVFKKDTGMQSMHYGRRSDKPVYSEGELDEVSAFFAEYGPMVYERSQALTRYLRTQFWEHPKVQSFRRVSNLLDALAYGIPVCLRISFPTDELHIPVGLLTNQTAADTTRLYVFDDKPLRGSEELFTITKWQSFGTAVKSRLSRFLPVYDADTVSILTHSGLSANLQDNVYFTEMSAQEKATFSEEGLARAKEIAQNTRQAVAQGHFGEFKKLVAHGAKVDGDTGGDLIRLAVEQSWRREGNIKAIVECLLANGANINTPDRYGHTALYLAVQRGGIHMDRYVDVIGFLIAHGGDFRSEAPRRIDINLVTAAARMGDAGVTRFLMNQGAAVNDADRKGQTPLIAAAEAGHLAIVKALLEHGAKIDSKGRSGHTALWHAEKADRKDVVEFLLEKGATPERPVGRENGRRR